MIELPRACIVADKIAADAQFFSFGTNDLTQTTFGISRDDCNKFLPAYLQQGIFKQDPFAVLDQEGVGTLIKMAANKGRSARRDWRSASVASMAASRSPSSSAIVPDSTTFPAHRTGC